MRLLFYPGRELRGTLTNQLKRQKASCFFLPSTSEKWHPFCVASAFTDVSDKITIKFGFLVLVELESILNTSLIMLFQLIKDS